mmetsp:Transcript_4115/g.11946  ORF Transcript_4115/g.11946 Transcript_4115/m.11946 type:complete len:201 (-) Transcript_4115:2744-3346(-)
MDRLRQRLQDYGPQLHGEHLVGLQAALREEHGLPLVARHRVQHGALQPAVELRGLPELQGGLRPLHHRAVQEDGQAELVHPGVDDDALDPPLEPGPLRAPEAEVPAHEEEGGRAGVDRRQGPLGLGLLQHQEGREDGLRGPCGGRGPVAGRRPVRAPLRLLEGHRQGERGEVLARRQRHLRHHWSRHVHRPPGSCLRRGR